MMKKGLPDRNFWSGKTVLVTGHTGFKGGWLSLWLSSMGASVHGLALNPNTDPNLYTVADIKRSIGMDIRNDIREYEDVIDAFKKSSPDVVFHLAAQPLVRESYRDPLYTLEANIMGSAHVLEAIRETSSVKVVVMVTTDKVYENKEWVYPYREVDPLGGVDPYSSSKACAELVISSYRESFLRKNGVSVSSVRAGNVVGGGDWSVDRLVPDAMKAFMKGESLVVRNPKSVRPWQHVLESLCGYLLLAEKQWVVPELYARAWNFAPEYESMTVGELAFELSKLWGGGTIWFKEEENAPHEAGLLTLDSSLARKHLGWRPRWNLMEALRSTVDWYKAFKEEQDMRMYSLEQIKEYCND
jgi:CDP-glucose 4,6-dehydratase